MRTVVDADVDAAVAGAGIENGATILIGGFGSAGQPVELIDELRRHGTGDLTVVSNNAGNGDEGLAALLKAGLVRRIVCSFPRQKDSWVFDDLYRSGRIELEVVRQGNLAERMRAAGAGIGAFFCPTGVGTSLAEGKEQRTIDGREYVLEYPIRGDVALVKADRADTVGNLVYRRTARNFGPIMCTAATTTLVQVEEVVEAGVLDPEAVVTPGIWAAVGDEIDPDLINAGKIPVTETPGTAYFHQADSFAISSARTRSSPRRAGTARRWRAWVTSEGGCTARGAMSTPPARRSRRRWPSSTVSRCVTTARESRSPTDRPFVGRANGATPTRCSRPRVTCS